MIGEVVSLTPVEVEVVYVRPLPSNWIGLAAEQPLAIGVCKSPRRAWRATKIFSPIIKDFKYELIHEYPFL
jgi:hypothetical protein